MPKIGKPDLRKHRRVDLRWIDRKVFDKYKARFGAESYINRDLSEICNFFMESRLEENKKCH